MTVYFMQRANGDIKIGYTKGMGSGRKTELEKRYGQLETLGVMDGELKAESLLHGRFWKYRQDGEFFSPCEELLEFIRSNTKKQFLAELSPTHLPVVPLPESGKRKVIVRLDELMNAAGVTQNDIATATGIPQGTISQWVRSKIDRFDGKTMAKLMDYFKCDVDDLLAIVPA